MNEKRMIGDVGEDAVCSYLRRRFYRIVARTYFCKMGEIDIIASRGSRLCFVEVKTRSPDAVDRPAAAVDIRKQRKIILTAQRYLQQNPTNAFLRFDVAEVTAKDGRVMNINYIQNAFECE